MSAWSWVALAAAGAAGAVCRYLVDFAVSDRLSRLLPWGTFLVNVSGSLLFGVIAGAFGGRVSQGAGMVLAVGFCGAYTTFSTHMLEGLTLAREARLASAAVYVVGSLLCGVLAAAAGLALGSALV